MKMFFAAVGILLMVSLAVVIAAHSPVDCDGECMKMYMEE